MSKISIHLIVPGLIDLDTSAPDKALSVRLGKTTSSDFHRVGQDAYGQGLDLEPLDRCSGVP